MKETQVKEQNKTKEIDDTLLEYNLSLSHEQRLENHQRAFELVQELIKARNKLNAKSK